MTRLDLAALLLAVALVVTGVALWAVPVAFIVAGVLLGALVLLREVTPDDKKEAGR